MLKSSKVLTGQRNMCPTCGQYFKSNAAFDKHRTGPFANNGRRCLSPAEMEAKGMFMGADEFWRTERMSEEAKAARWGHKRGED